ncbi:MAG: heme-binding protein [Vicinamibacterales bacterium]
MAAVAFLPVCLAAQASLPTRQTLTLEAARRIAAAAEAEAVRHNWVVSIAVVDDGGHLMVFLRMDGTKLVATDIAIRKARTAVYFQGPTKGLEDEVSGGRTALLPIEGFMPLEGGVPLMANGQLVGAIGVSGVTGAEDAQCAQAGAAALKPGSR